MKPRYRPDADRVSFRHERLDFPFPADRPLRLAVVADTHSKPHPRLAEHLRGLGPDAILHGGDIGSADVLDNLASIAPVLAVRGNIDDPALAVPDAITLRLVRGEARAFTLLLIHIAVAGPRLRSEILELAEREGAALVVCGHSHIPFVGSDRGVTIFNPGSIGPRRVHLPILFGEILVADRVTFRHLDAETGETWMPPR